MKLDTKSLAILIFFFVTTALRLNAQTLQILESKVSENDSINLKEDTVFGVGDDGIYNVVEPSVRASSELKENKNVFFASNISDFNLTTPWIEGKSDYGICEYIEFTFDLTGSNNGDSAFSINSFFVINGYRKSLKIWRDNSRVKKFKMYIDNIPFAFILLNDTYLYQSFQFPDYWIKYGEKKIIRFEIVEIYPGEKFKDTAISELEFEGIYDNK
jgi:hypothetical protein